MLMLLIFFVCFYSITIDTLRDNLFLLLYFILTFLFILLLRLFNWTKEFDRHFLLSFHHFISFFKINFLKGIIFLNFIWRIISALLLFYTTTILIWFLINIKNIMIKIIPFTTCLNFFNFPIIWYVIKTVLKIIII